MNRSYEDLMSLTPARPSFFQKDGVPRWGTFQPGVSTDVYAVEAVVMEISCQSCDGRFHVLMERRSHGDPTTLAQRIADGSIHYGDPPNVDCCLGGPSMNSEPVRILEYWSRERMDWTRDPSLEIHMRRMGDPMTDAMREEMHARMESADTSEEIVELIRDALVSDDERRAAPPSTEEPVRYSEYAERCDF